MAVLPLQVGLAGDLSLPAQLQDGSCPACCSKHTWGKLPEPPLRRQTSHPGYVSAGDQIHSQPYSLLKLLELSGMQVRVVVLEGV